MLLERGRGGLVGRRGLLLRGGGSRDGGGAVDDIVVLVDVLDVFDFVYDKFVVAAPGEFAPEFAVVELDEATALAHQQFSDFLVVDGEIEFVGLKTGSRAGYRSLRGEAGLDEASLIGLENDAFLDDEIEFAGLGSFAENKVKMEIECSGSNQNADDANPKDDFFHDSHKIKISGRNNSGCFA